MMTKFRRLGDQLVAVDQDERICAAWEGPDELLRGLEVVLAQEPALADAIATACGLVKPADAQAKDLESLP